METAVNDLFATESLGDEATPAGRLTAVDPDGFLYDCDTGEVLGRADVEEAFRVDSREKAEWVLELRSRIEGDVAGIDARLKALQSHLQAQRAAAVRRLAWWDWRFRPSLVDFARSALAGRARTAVFDWGRVAFRKTQGARRIVDMGEAVEFVELWAPSGVRVVKTVTLKAVQAAVEAMERATGEAEGVPGFVVQGGAGEAVEVSTGVELNGG